MEFSTCQIDSVSFKLFDENEIKKLSVLPVTTVQTFDPLGHPYDNGLADTALGPLKRNDFCKTCGLTDSHCLGHFGHIQLPLPVFNPFLIKQIFQILKMFCFKCHRLLFSKFKVEVLLAQYRAINLGLDYILDDIETFSNEIAESTKGFDWNSIEGQTYLHRKLNDFIKSEFKKMKSTVKNCLNCDEDFDLVEFDSVEIVNSKNVIEKKQQLFKNFIGCKLLKPNKVCLHCSSRKAGLNVINKSLIIMSLSKARSSSTKFDTTDDGQELTIEMKGKSYLTPSQAREHFRQLWSNECKTLLRFFPFLNLDDIAFSKANPTVFNQSNCPMDVFFWDTIIVSPNRFRPLRHVNGRSFENIQTTALSQLMIVAKSLEYTLDVAKKNNSGDTIAKFHAQWQRLQILCNRIYDSQMDNLPDNKSIGVKQILEKKEGLMRKNMMGKRVNFAARSVISPDPYIMVDEIGVPVVFATKLSYPQPVTAWNVKKLQEMVINGPLQYPGALSVTYEDGYTVRLKPDDATQRRSVAANIQPPSLHQGFNGVKVVNRHLISGDVLLLNRQPTLHKPSIMAHKARVLPREKTLRLHYANCKCYNADFDGDEMNAHFPQSELARAEAYHLASVNYQFLVPKDGSPLSGLIQDHIIAGLLLSIRGRFFNKNDYQELVYGALSFLNKPIRYLPPSIIKPQRLWSGKQIISTLVINLIPIDKPLPTFEIESKISSKLLTVEKPRPALSGGSPLTEKELCESQVIFRRGELLCGLMDKSNFGANKNGLIHVCYELYGDDAVHTRLLTSIARLCTNFLQFFHGFTLGIHDILIKPKPNHRRAKLIQNRSNTIGILAVKETFNLPPNVDFSPNDPVIVEKLQIAHTMQSDLLMKQLDHAYKSQTDSLNNEISELCMSSKGLVKPFPANNLQMMIQTGAKGGSVNAIQISCLLGQIELEGRRIPLMMSGRTLPSFRPYDIQPRAGGFVTGRFLSGIRPQEFFFHCMAGREGLIDTAVKTSRSGYLQRCLIKHLEGLVVNYDLTVRDSEGSVVQWLYGEDGVDILKSQSLQKSFLLTIWKNQEALRPSKTEMSKLISVRNPVLLKKIEKNKKWLKRLAGIDLNTRSRDTSPFLRFESENFEKNNSIKLWNNLSQEGKNFYFQKIFKPIDPIIAQYRPDSNLGAISETLERLIDDFINENLQNYSNELIDDFRVTLAARYQRSLCAPGEAVGLLAAQSIGEPSTQMTLNTFHFAGRGEMNVTLGVPRLRELLMTASSQISTPSMYIPFRSDLASEIDLNNEAENVRLKLNAVRLKDVLEYVDIEESIEIQDDNGRSSGTTHHRYRIYRIDFVFLPKSFYKRRCFTRPGKVLQFMEQVFIKRFIEAMNRRIRLLTKSYGLFDTKKASNTRSNRSFGKKIIDGDEEQVLLDKYENDFEWPEKSPAMVSPNEDDDDDEDLDDYDVDEGEGDTTAMRQRSRINQEQEYDEAEQEEVEMNGEEEDFDDNNDGQRSQTNDENEPFLKIKQEFLDEEKEIETPVFKQHKKSSENSKKNSDAAYTTRCKNVVDKNPDTIIEYQYDREKELWCQVTLRFELLAAKLDLRSIVEEETAKAFIHRVGRIDRAFLVKDNEAAKRGAQFSELVQTEGVSLSHLVEFEHLLDVKKVYTNDMHAIAQTYGIEAARAALIREIKNVFSVYGISVDGRHLSLIADYMTFTGVIKGMNRGAMDGISPLQAMTFETTTNFMKNSLLIGLKDKLQSPSSRLVIGRPAVVGTGLFETRVDPAVMTKFNSLNSSLTFLSEPSTSQISKSLGHSRFLKSVSSISSFLSPSYGGGHFKMGRKRNQSDYSIKSEIKSDDDEDEQCEINQIKHSATSLVKRIKLEFDE